MTAPLTDLMDPSWAQALTPVADRIAGLGDFLRAESRAGYGYLPRGEQVLRAFAQPLDAVRVVLDKALDVADKHYTG